MIANFFDLKKKLSNILVYKNKLNFSHYDTSTSLFMSKSTSTFYPPRKKMDYLYYASSRCRS